MLYTKHPAVCTQLHKNTAHAVHINTQLYAQIYITLLHVQYTQTHSYMHTIKLHYCTCCTHNHTPLCTKLHNVIAHAVHKYTELYAHNYITLLYMLYKHTAVCTQLYNIIAHVVQKNTELYAHNYITLLHILYPQTHRYMHTIA